MLNRTVIACRTVWSHGGFQRYLKNTSWLFGGQMLRMVLGLFVSVAVARYLGPVEFGIFNYVVAVVALVAVVCTLGMQNVAKRDLVNHPENRNQILGTCFALSALSSIVSYGIMMLVAVKHGDNLLTGLFALLGGSILFAPFQFINVWFQSQVQAKLSVTSTSIALVIFAVAKVMAILNEGTLYTFAWISMGELIVVAVIQSFLFTRHYGSLFSWRFEWLLGRELLRQSWPLIFSGLAVSVYLRVDQIMLGNLIDDNAVGIYAAATRVSQVWYFVPMILASSLFPAILNSKKQGEQIYMARLQRYYDLNTGLAYLIAVPVTIVSPWVISLLFGGAYSGASEILRLHVWAGLFVFLGVARNQFLTAEGLFRYSMYCTISGAIVNVFLNYLLIPRFAGVGAAMATLVSQITSAWISSYFHVEARKSARLQVASLLIPFRLSSAFKQ